jgi:hypothetical protein
MDSHEVIHSPKILEPAVRIVTNIRMDFGNLSKFRNSGGATATSGKLFTADSVRTFPEYDIKFGNNSKTYSPTIIQNDERNCEKWSVVTTIFDPSDALQLQATLGSEWCMVVVGDLKSPKNFHLYGSSHVVYLDSEEQSSLGKKWKIIKYLPWNHFGRKNIAYLYAISHGAKMIWDMDDDNILKSKDIFLNFIPKEKVDIRMASSNDFPSYNPYIHFGAPHKPVWPRGFPLDQIKDERSWNNSLSKETIENSKIGLIQSLADNDPDIDAIFRLTMTIPFNFKIDDTNSIPLALPPKTLSPLNAQACLFNYDAFWMMLLPITVHGRVSDIWRGYLGQRLLWDIDLKVLFAPPVVNQFRNSHNYLADLNSELPLYEKPTALLNFLKNWKPKEKTLIARIEELSIEFYNRLFTEIEDVYLMQMWLQTLLDVGYVFPTI